MVIAEDDADAEHVRQTLGVLMHDHPSRAIVLKASEGAELGARVFAECWMPFGRNQQICSEGIEMTADAANLGEVANLLLPLIVPDRLVLSAAVGRDSSLRAILIRRFRWPKKLWWIPRRRRTPKVRLPC